MYFAPIDSKLKSLASLCKENNNYKSLTIAIITLISNKVNKIGIKLGIRPRLRIKDNTKLNRDETLYEYMCLINDVIYQNLNRINLFREEDLKFIKESEIRLKREEGTLPKEYIEKLIEIFYDLRKIDVPNLMDDFNDGMLYHTPKEKFMSTFLFNRSKKKNDDYDIRKIMLYKIKKKQERLQNEWDPSNFNKNLFNKAFYFKGAIKSIRNGDQKKTIFAGRLKDNVDYQKSMHELIGNAFLGAFMACLILALGMIYETLLFPQYINTLSILILLFLGPSILFFLIYWCFFLKN